ncbi:hypothetical protein [Hyalangium versicolor]|uniref:hypothetical protein n=1 Tax=Hyalangium versicolor TaxID=2861190 RepID=UPI001CCBBAF3|nr:hypothetical protein [Hyalangium versicolor]
MLSSISPRVGSNPIQSLGSRGQAPKGEAKAGAAKGLDSKDAESLQKVLGSLEQILEQLVQKLSGGKVNSLGGSESGGSSGSGSGSAKAVGGSSGCSKKDSFTPSSQKAAPSGLPSLDGSSGPAKASKANSSNETGGDMVAGIKVTDPRLRDALEKIASHPDGAKLLAAAKANGLNSISADSGLNPDGGSGTEGLTTWGNGSTRIDIADPSSPDLIHTLAHELGHAATTGDGDSQLEEKTVDALGERIQRDLTGKASGFNLDVGAYGNLAGDNGIYSSLSSLGIEI